ncbi:MAG: phasin family protein [Pseudomonadota bacterium]
MATAKKKPSAKRTVKYAAKAQTGAARTAASAVNKNAAWATQSANDWQKGASDWAKQSAKLYPLSFAQGDVGAATKQAADTVKSATENMMKMSSDMMQQFFGQAGKAMPSASSFNPSAMFAQMPGLPEFKMPQMPAMPAMPNFDPAAAQEKLAAFTRESSEQLSKASTGASRALNESVTLAQENLSAASEVSNVAVTVSKELAAEIIGFMNKQFAQNVELSKQVLTCRTLNDMFDLATRITKTNLDGFFSESVKISEMVFQCATDVSEPLNERLSDTTDRLTKAMAA